MRDYKITAMPVEKGANWEVIIRIKFQPDSIPNGEELCQWVARYPGYAFVFANYYQRILGKGVSFSTDPEKKYPPTYTNGQLYLDYYEVRFEKEEMYQAFMKVWNYPEAERKRNEEWKQQQREKASGYVFINGERYLPEQLMPIPKEPILKAPRVIPNHPLMAELRTYISEMKLQKDGRWAGKGRYFYRPVQEFDDFAREIERERSLRWPKGVLAIRGDDGFWIIACLPIRFAELTTQQIVSVLWPDKEETAIYHGDQDDVVYWTARFKRKPTPGRVIDVEVTDLKPDGTPDEKIIIEVTPTKPKPVRKRKPIRKKKK